MATIIFHLKRNALYFLLLLLMACNPKLTPQQHLLQAQQQISQNNLQAAEVHLKNALQQDSQLAEARLLLGQVRLQQMDPAAAEMEFQRALDTGANVDQALPLMGMALLQQSKWPALQQLPAASLSNTHRGPLLATQAQGLMSDGQLQHAGELLAKALDDTPDDRWVRLASARYSLLNGDHEKGRKVLQALTAAHPDYAPAWVLLGDLERNEQHLELALQDYQRAVELDARDFSTRLKLISVQLDLGDLTTAESAIAQLPDNQRQLLHVQLLQGLLKFKQGQYQDAINSLTEPLRHPQQFPQALLLTGYAHWKLQHFAQAEKYAKEFYQLEPNSLDATLLLGTILLKQKHLEELEKILSPMQQTHPDNIQLLGLLAEVQLRHGEFDKAITTLTRITELDPESVKSQVQLGFSWLQKDQQQTGLQHFQSALEMDPTYHEAYAYLAMYYLQQQQPQKAIDTVLRYQQQRPDAAAPLNLLARVYLASGAPEAAQQSFAEALKKDPGNPLASGFFIQQAFATKDYDRVRQLAEQVLSDHPDNLDAHMQLARLELLQGDASAMVTRLESVILTHPEAAAPRAQLARYYLTKGEALKAQGALGQLPQRQDSPVEVQQLLALSQLQQRQFKAAMSTLEPLTRQQPVATENYFMLAQAYAGAGHEKKMQQTLEQLLQQEPKHLKALIALTRLHLTRGDTKAATSSLNTLESIAAELPDVLILRGIWLEQRHQPEQALAVYQTLFEQQPSTENLLRLSRQNNLLGIADNAIALLTQWLQQHPQDIAARHALAGTHLIQQQTDAAIGQYQAILKQQPENLPALNNLAWHLRATAPKQALEYAEKAYKLYPNRVEVLDTYAMTLLDNKQTKQALRQINRALEQRPDDPSIQFHRAMIESQRGNHEIASNLLKELLETPSHFPEREDAEQLLSQLQTTR